MIASQQAHGALQFVLGHPRAGSDGAESSLMADFFPVRLAQLSF